MSAGSAFHQAPGPRRQIRFCATPRGARIAYATAGTGPALLVPAAWISHLELLWQDPAYRAFFTPLTAARTVVQYDRPGCGLSEPWPGRVRIWTPTWRCSRRSPTTWASSASTCSASRWAPRCRSRSRRGFPERVGRLVLYGGFADGRADRLAARPRRHARPDPRPLGPGLGGAGRRLPARGQRREPRRSSRGCSGRRRRAESAVEVLAQCYETEVTDLLAQVAAPTLVLHRRDDRAIPYRGGPRRWPRRSRARGWCRCPAGATSRTSATPPPSSARSWSSWGAPAAPPPGARPGPARADRAAAAGGGAGRRGPDQPADRRAAGHRGALRRGARRAHPRCGSASPPAPRSPPGGPAAPAGWRPR